MSGVISWSLAGSLMVLDGPTTQGYEGDEAGVRDEVRKDAALVARLTRKPVEVVTCRGKTLATVTP